MPAPVMPPPNEDPLGPTPPMSVGTKEILAFLLGMYTAKNGKTSKDAEEVTFSEFQIRAAEKIAMEMDEVNHRLQINTIGDNLNFNAVPRTFQIVIRGMMCAIMLEGDRAARRASIYKLGFWLLVATNVGMCIALLLHR